MIRRNETTGAGAAERPSTDKTRVRAVTGSLTKLHLIFIVAALVALNVVLWSQMAVTYFFFNYDEGFTT